MCTHTVLCTVNFKYGMPKCLKYGHGNFCYLLKNFITYLVSKAYDSTCHNWIEYTVSSLISLDVIVWLSYMTLRFRWCNVTVLTVDFSKEKEMTKDTFDRNLNLFSKDWLHTLTIICHIVLAYGRTDFWEKYRCPRRIK